MGEGPIVEVMVAKAFGIGLELQWQGGVSLYLVLPFVMVNITFKRKTEHNDWYRFINTF